MNPSTRVRIATVLGLFLSGCTGMAPDSSSKEVQPESTAKVHQSESTPKAPLAVLAVQGAVVADAAPSADAASSADLTCSPLSGTTCNAGAHWDAVLCSCLPDRCISHEDGPCGGSIAHPCQCAPGLVCNPGRTRGLPGTCEGPQRRCDPVPCPTGEAWDPSRCRCQQACTKDVDCQAKTPSECVACPDGTPSCAHWLCTAGKCEIAYCK
jgi:hypothetical protein